MKQAVLYKKLKDHKIECSACMHRCILSNGKKGICNVRQNKDGKLYLLVYGKAAALNIDPIEKKPLYHFFPGTSIFSIGTSGCNFKCKFCQNWELSQSDKIVGEKLMPSEIIDICIRGGIPSIAYTYNEPAIFFEYAYDISKLAHFKGIKNVYVTSGYETPEALEMISPYLDAMNIDLKSFNEEFYKKLCNASLSPVLETIKKAYKLGIWIEITTLIIPGENNSDAELEKIARFIASVDKSIPWHVSAFRPCYKLTEKSPTPHSDLIKAYNIGKKAGLNHVYVGNIISKKYSTTYCGKCNQSLIERDGGFTAKIMLKDKKCFKCGKPLKGVF